MLVTNTKFSFLLIGLFGGTVIEPSWASNYPAGGYLGMDFGTFTDPKQLNVDYGTLLVPADYPTDLGTPNVAV